MDSPSDPRNSDPLRPAERILRAILADGGTRPDFAAELRRRFVDGRVGGARAIAEGVADERSTSDGIIAGAPVAPADPEFRHELRQRFVAGSLGDERSEAQSVAAPVRSGAVDDERVHGAYRARLRARFVLGELDLAAAADASGNFAAAADASGNLAAAADAAGNLAAAADTTGSRERTLAVAPAAPIHDLAARRARWLPVAATLVAAAALFAFLLPTALGPEWLVHRRPPESSAVLFDRRPLGAETRALDVATGRVLACGEEGLRLALESHALVELEPMSQVRFCAPIWRPFAAPLAPIHLDSGELNLSTLRGTDRTITVDTADVLVRFHDAAVSIRASEQGTCIVVLDGEVEAIPSDVGERRTVGAGDRYYVSRCGRACSYDPGLCGSDTDALGDRLRGLRSMLVDIEAGVF